MFLPSSNGNDEDDDDVCGNNFPVCIWGMVAAVVLRMVVAVVVPTALVEDTKHLALILKTAITLCR